MASLRQKRQFQVDLGTGGETDDVLVEPFFQSDLLAKEFGRVRYRLELYDIARSYPFKYQR